MFLKFIIGTGDLYSVTDYTKEEALSKALELAKGTGASPENIVEVAEKFHIFLDKKNG